MKHVLVVGGTGMLSDVSLYLAQYHHVSVIARRREGFKRLTNQAKDPSAFTFLSIDYRHDMKLQTALQQTISSNGPISCVVAWIHSTAPKALAIICAEIANMNDKQPWKLFHIMGSSSNVKQMKAKVPTPKRCHYRQIQLGYVKEEGISRWLTHQEIANGVLEAIATDTVKKVIGVIEPWEERP